MKQAGEPDRSREATATTTCQLGYVGGARNTLNLFRRPMRRKEKRLTTWGGGPLVATSRATGLGWRNSQMGNGNFEPGFGNLTRRCSVLQKAHFQRAGRAGCLHLCLMHDQQQRVLRNLGQATQATQAPRIIQNLYDPARRHSELLL